MRTLSEFWRTLQFVQAYDARAKMFIPATMNDWLPIENKQHFYTYRGSLTTPPCSEVVTWMVYYDILPINMFDVSKK